MFGERGFRLGEDAQEIIDGERLQLDADGKAALQFGNKIAGLGDVERRVLNEETAAALQEAIKSESSAPLPYEERVAAAGPEKVFLIDAEYVKQMVASVVKDQDLSRYIL